MNVKRGDPKLRVLLWAYVFQDFGPWASALGLQRLSAVLGRFAQTRSPEPISATWMAK